MHAPGLPPAVSHCLLLEDSGRLALIDTGLGTQDIARPLERLGQTLIDIVGFQLLEDEPALRQIERLGLSPTRLTDIVLTHADVDHVGGLSDFPAARVHLSAEELRNVTGRHPRYVQAPFAHQPRWNPIESAPLEWYGLPATPLQLELDADALLVSLPGHTLGHCGVAIRLDSTWLLHVGDAYYLRVELTADDHPVSALAAQRADDDAQRRHTLHQLRRLARDHADEITMLGYHDPDELPGRHER